MRILFVKPPSNSHLIFPPIGILQLATCCKSVADVEILDCLKEGYTHKEFRAYIERNDFDVVAISSFSAESLSAVRCAKIVKDKSEDIVTIIGGTHLHNLYHTTADLKISNVDYTIVGEAEESLPLFIEELKKPASERKLENISGLNYVVNGKIITNEPKLIIDIDSLPNTDWSLIDLKSYPRSYLARRHPYAPVLTSRGCPYLCTFCSIPSISGRKFRPRSPEKVVEEMKSLYEIGIREIMFWDDNFTLIRSRAMKLCELLIKEDMDLVWSCPQGVRIDLIDEELLSKMKQAKCYYVALGIESGSDKVLKDMKKNITVQKIKEKVPLVKKAGINAWGFFILGYPTETKEDVMATIKLSRHLNLSRVSYHLYQPVPGTESFDTFVTDKNIQWERLKFSESMFRSEKITPKELKKMQRKAFLQFYLRPNVLSRFVLDNLTIHQVTEVLKMFKEYIIHKDDKDNLGEVEEKEISVVAQD